MGKGGYKGAYSKSYSSGDGQGDKGGGKGWDQGYASQEGSGWKGKHGKGNAWPQEDWTGPTEGTPDQERTGRIQTNYQLPKALLRASANTDGGCLVKQQKDRRPDNEILDVASLEKMMDTNSTHLVRRPGTGWSESMASLRHGIEMLKQFLADKDKDVGKELKFEKLVRMLGDPEVESAIAYIDSSCTTDPEKKDLISAIKKFTDFVSTDDNAAELAHAGQQLAIVGGRLYLAGIHLLQLIVAVTQPEVISKKMPKHLSEEKHVKKWQAKPKDKDAMTKALAALLLEALEKRKAYGDSSQNTASSVLGMTRKKKRKSSSSSSQAKASSASSESVKPKKKNKKTTKDKKKKQKTSSTSSTAEDKKKKEKKSKKGKKADGDKRIEKKEESQKDDDTVEKEDDLKAAKVGENDTPAAETEKKDD